MQKITSVAVACTPQVITYIMIWVKSVIKVMAVQVQVQLCSRTKQKFTSNLNLTLFIVCGLLKFLSFRKIFPVLLTLMADYAYFVTLRCSNSLFRFFSFIPFSDFARLNTRYVFSFVMYVVLFMYVVQNQCAVTAASKKRNKYAALSSAKP